MNKLEDLQFSDWDELIANKIGKAEWISVFSRTKSRSDVDRGLFFPALVPNSLIKGIMKSHSWDIHSISGGKPGFVTYYQDGNEVNRYYRFSENGIEHLVYWRLFTGIDKGYYEISEEFRLFHDLYEKDNKFYHFNINGDRILAIEILEFEIKFKKHFLKQYLSAREMSLVLYYDAHRFSPNSIQEGSYEEGLRTCSGENYIYTNGIRDCTSFTFDEAKKSQGWITGKLIIKGYQEYSHKDAPNEYCEYIIDQDDEGRNIRFSCDEEKLANYFGKNKDNPNYLTPVYFKKEVLSKYYANPKDYSVTDGDVERHGFWALRIDNNTQNEFINVFLGDLGKLHYSEQMYWLSYNVYSESGMSHTNIQRSLIGEFCEPETPDLYFKQSFESFQKDWFEQKGWHLFMPLSTEDKHYYQTLHTPLKQDQKEFEQQILSLTKILIDSINQKELKKYISIEEDQNLQGINKFEKYLEQENLNSPQMIQFIRDLQSLRSTGVVHRKGNKYLKIKKKFNLNNDNYIETFNDILIKSIRVFNTITTRILKKNS